MYFWFIILLSIIVFLIYPVPDFISPAFFSASSSLYFYSALLQANAAILSIIGVFIIFRIQSHQGIIDIIKNALMSDRGRTVSPSSVIEFNNYDLNGKKNHLNNLLKQNTGNILINQYKTWIENEDKISKIKESVKLPTILLAAGILFNSFGLITSNYIHNFQVIYETITYLVQKNSV